MTIECPQCHYKNPDDAEFCEQCGAELPVGGLASVGAASNSSVGTTGSTFASSGTAVNSTPAAAPASIAAAPTVDENICPNCKAPFAPGDQFCFNCGADLRNVGSNATASATPASVPSFDPALSGSAAPTIVAAPAPIPSPVPENDPFADAFAALDNPPANTNNAPATSTPAPSGYVPTMVTPPSTPAPATTPAAPVVDPSPTPAPQPVVNAAPAPVADPAPRQFSTSPLITQAPPTPAPAPQPTSVATFTLHVSGPHGDETIPYPGREMLLGRRDPRTRVFPDLNLDDSATSRRHLALWIDADEGKAYAQDLESANGTSLNGHDLEPGNPTELKDGDTIKVGTRYSIQVTFG